MNNLNRRIKRLTAAILLTLTAMQLYAAAPQLAILPDTGPLNMQRYAPALQSHLDQFQCAWQVTEGTQDHLSSPSEKMAVFATFETAPEPWHLALRARTRNDVPLRSAWVARRFTSVHKMADLIGEPVAVAQPTSDVGYRIPLKLASQHGVVLSPNNVQSFSSYLAMITMLIHGDVHAAALPLPLATDWQRNNGLILLTTSKKELASGIWLEQGTALPPGCAEALLHLKKAHYNDPRFKLFPEWVEGFHPHNAAE